eukprot:TRINITY_DN5786_c0_g1_i1.p1 TRINITY_DN5786_c0_g1~~TRINITY_DN5786_c0_g1_i1.p1  ORF type:complete len:129 (-),score=42.08 TRINITY_DN5786_c0_g1_i1:25-411(-)
MKHQNTKQTNLSYTDAVNKIKENLKEEGFGIITEINVKDTLKNKINVDFKNYVILGACNPQIAHQVLEEENLAGVYMPCNVVVFENKNGVVEVSSVNPVNTISTFGNEKLTTIAQNINQKLENAINKL